jgi:WD40 repeat protein
MEPPPSSSIDEVEERVLGLTLKPQPAKATRFALAPHFVAAADLASRRLFVWRREHPEAPLFKAQLDQMPTVLSFSPDERLLVIGHLGGKLARWDLTQKPYRILPAQHVLTGPIFALTFSPDGTQLFTGSGAGDRHIRQWDPWPLDLVREFPERHAVSLSALQVSPDSKLLASASDDGEVVLWDTATWREVGSLPHAPDTLFKSVAFEQNAHLVAAGDSGVWTWRISDKDLLEAACHLANRTMEPDEWEQSVGGARPQTGCALKSDLTAHVR